MNQKATLIRWIALPACLAWGLLEFLALQKAHFLKRG